jgi:heme-degrading monooxygenase HmoA
MSVVVVFTSRRTPLHDDEYHAMAAHMEQLVAGQPGFLSITSVRDPVTRQGITVAHFADDAAVLAWKAHPEHLEAQRRGIDAFYEDYEVTVADVRRQYGSAACSTT